MSLTQTSIVCPPTNTCLPKLTPQTHLSFPAKLLQDNKFNSLKKCGKTAVLYNGYSYFTSPCHPLELELPKYLMDSDADDDNHEGIGILNFLSGKNIFITGATGLVGKVLVEKMLRSTAVGKIYVLIKAKDKEAAFDRLTKEVISSDLFESLKEAHGNNYEAFVREKLVPVVGNICEPNLGMDANSANSIKKDVDIIIGSAASVTLNERYDKLLDANVIAPQRLMRFAKTCPNLKLFTHISTAFVNGKREGTIPENPLIMGENRRKYDDNEIPSSHPLLDIADEIQLAFKSSKDAPSEYEATKNLKRLGQARADFFGWANPYYMTKAMGEMVLNEIREDIPLLIIRPSFIESIYNDPLPGWIQGNRMYDPVIISYGKGQLPAFFADPEVAMDIIPVDIVANATIAAMAKHGSINRPRLNVYHVSSSSVNPLKYSEFFEYLYQYFKSAPLVEGATISRVEFFDNFKDFSEYIREEIHRRSEQKSEPVDDGAVGRKLQSRCKAKVAYAEQVCKMYESAGFLKAKFHTGNTQNLLQEMSKEEQLVFEVDATKINWQKYFQEIHIPGLREHVINSTKVSI